MTRHTTQIKAGLALATASLLAALAGCGSDTDGYKDAPPPPGGPQQSSNVPPGERAKADAAKANIPGNSGH